MTLHDAIYDQQEDRRTKKLTSIVKISLRGISRTSVVYFHRPRAQSLSVACQQRTGLIFDCQQGGLRITPLLEIVIAKCQRAINTICQHVLVWGRV